MKKRLMFVMCLSCAGIAGAANLLTNGDFSSGRTGWDGNNFAGGEGRLGFADGVARLEKTRGPGGVQMMQRVTIPKGVSRLRFACRAKGPYCNFYVKFYGAGKKPQAILNSLGQSAQAKLVFGGSKDWKALEMKVAVPEAARTGEAQAQAHFGVGAAVEGPNVLEVDDVVLEPIAEETAPDVAPLKYEFVPAPPKSTAYGKVTPIDGDAIELKDGFFRRSGRPCFLIGNGCDLGSSHATPVGLWLARLQGQDFVALPDGNAFCDKMTDGTLRLAGAFPSANRSWIREAERLGFLTQSLITSRYFKWSNLKKYTKDHPDFADIHYDAGHYLSIDTGTEVGRKMMATKREAVYRELEDDPFYFTEFAREPGPEPCNRRVQDSFREWAKKKYGTIAEANRVWKSDYADWAAVRPPHLPADIIRSGGHVRKIELREWALKNRRNMYYDWLLFAQADNMSSFAGEVADVRRATPGIRLSLDVRGHMTPSDSYMLYDPNGVDRLVDYFEIHDGYRAVYYQGGTYDEKVLRTTMAFPVFKHNYFRSNTTHPIWNAEDIVSVVGCATSSKDSMRKNDLCGLLEADWDFAKDPEEKGLAAKWYENPGAVAWEKIPVPQAWDALPAHKGYTGTAWYRRTFTIRAVYKNDYDDGSRRFFFAGAGMAQQGEAWLNGKRIGEVKGWAKPFKMDVSDVLNYGGQNELVIRVCGNGGFLNGLRGHYHILPGDRMGETHPFGEAQYKAMLWGYLMRGVSAVSVWNWTTDPFRPFLPELGAKLDEVASFALPALRRQQRAHVAFLYPYVYARGLPIASQIDDAKVWQTWFNAALFSGVEPDIVGEETFVGRVTAKDYPLLIAPAASLVDERTFEHFKRYLAEGGTAIVTEDSFGRTFTRYEKKDLAALAGTRVVMPADMTMEAAQKAFKSYLPKPAFAFAVEPNGENPLVECMCEGTDEKKVLYFHNWGAKDAHVSFALPDALKGWKLTALEGDFSRSFFGFGGTYSVTVPSQGPVVAVLTRDTNYEWKLPANVAANAAELHRLATTLPTPDSTASNNQTIKQSNSSPRALFLKATHHSDAWIGPEVYPTLVEGLQKRGYAVEARPPAEWTPETLAKYDLIVLTEAKSHAANELIAKKNVPNVVARVKAGGRLLFMNYTAHTINAGAFLNREGRFRELGLAGGGAGASSVKDAAFGDPWQLTTDNVSGELATGVKSVLLYQSDSLALTKDSPLKPVVSFPADARGKGAGKPVVAAGAVGRGKVVVSSDILLFQPTRIEHADNAQLLENVLDYLK